MADRSRDILPDDYVRAIGRLVVAAQHLDILLTDLTGRLLHTYAVYTIVVLHHQKTTNKIDNLKALCKIAFGEDVEQTRINDLLDKIKRFIEYRNTVVHSYWTITEDGTIYGVRFNSRGKLTRQRYPYNSSQIHEHADKALDLTEELREWLKWLSEKLQNAHSSQ